MLFRSLTYIQCNRLSIGSKKEIKQDENFREYIFFQLFLISQIKLMQSVNDSRTKDMSIVIISSIKHFYYY